MTIWDDGGSKLAEQLIAELIRLFGDDPCREGLAETPGRAVNMFREMLEGMRYSNSEIANIAEKCFDDDFTQTSQGIVIVKDISVHSFCEHHIALIYNMKVTAAYIPCGRVIGLSKIARIADLVAKRMTLQERMGADIAEIIGRIAGTDDVAVLIEGEHSCMAARGVSKTGAVTKTAIFKGKFEKDESVKQTLLGLI
ncbi:MAG: GTP cyclohydrolase I [Oscillospiraceae bacterium]|nr:GTP cyclohydrolase I [Oscillospiraceae bacterium]